MQIANKSMIISIWRRPSCTLCIHSCHTGETVLILHWILYFFRIQLITWFISVWNQHWQSVASVFFFLQNAHLITQQFSHLLSRNKSFFHHFTSLSLLLCAIWQYVNVTANAKLKKKKNYTKKSSVWLIFMVDSSKLLLKFSDVIELNVKRKKIIT